MGGSHIYGRTYWLKSKFSPCLRGEKCLEGFMSYVIGCDIGTSGTKAIVVSETGKILSKVMVEYPLSIPHPGWAEQHPDTWAKATFKAIGDAVRKARVPTKDVRALGF